MRIVPISMVDSFDFSDTETNFKRVKTEQSTSSKTSPASSPRSYSNNHFRTNNYNHKYDHNRNGSRQNFNSNYRNNYHNENRLDNNHRTTGYLGSKRPFKGNLTSFRPPTMYRKPVTSFSKNLKEESNRVLPKFNDFVPYKGRSFDAQGYRDPKYYDSSKKPGNRNISKTFYNNQQFTPSNFESGHENDEQVLSPANSIEKETKSETKSSPIISEIPNSPPIYLNNNKQDEDSSYFQIKTINSYKEFCRIKAKGSIEFATIYETISFLKAMTTNFRTGMKPIFLFFDKFERVFYGAAVVCLDEISEREQIDTNALESLIFRLNWIFLSEIEESNADFLYSQELKDSTVLLVQSFVIFYLYFRQLIHIKDSNY